MTLPTIVIRHTRENLKKCSLRGLEGLPDFAFYRYPDCVMKSKLPALTGYVMLDIEGEPLSPRDKETGLILIDATWRLAEKIVRCVPELQNVPKRSIPQGFRTAYPRRQEDCIDPTAGLASIEALFVAYWVMGRPCEHLLENYYWKTQFLEKNADLLVKNPPA